VNSRPGSRSSRCSSWGPRAAGGTLISVSGYEVSDHDLTVHVAVDVVAGGWAARATNPHTPDVLVCYAIIVTGNAPTATPDVNAEPCRYPLTG